MKLRLVRFEWMRRLWERNTSKSKCVTAKESRCCNAMTMTKTTTDGNQKMTTENDEHNMYIDQIVSKWKMESMFWVMFLFFYLGTSISLSLALSLSIFQITSDIVVVIHVCCSLPVYISVNSHSTAWCYFNHHILNSLYEFESRIQISQRFRSATLNSISFFSPFSFFICLHLRTGS